MWPAGPSNSPEETLEKGREIGTKLVAGQVVCLFGELGAGKTTLAKGIVAGATEAPPEEVSSPTFVYLHVYEGKVPVYHFDLYRLKNSDAFLAMGFDEYFHDDGICLVEWAERIADIIPKDALRVTLAHLGEGERTIGFSQG